MRRLWPWLLKSTITGGLLYYIFTKVPMPEVLTSLREAQGVQVGAALALTILSRWPAACRMKRLTALQGISLSVLRLAAISFMSTFYGFLLPGSVSGGFARWYKLIQQDRKPAAALTSIVFDRLAATVSLAVVGLGAWLLSPATRAQTAIGIALGGICAALLLATILAFNGRSAAWLLAVLNRPGASRVPQTIRRRLVKLLHSVMRFRALPGRAHAEIFGLSLTVHLMTIAGFYGFTTALGLTVPLLDLVWIHCAITLLTMLPITVSGIGVREGGLILLLAPFGVAPAAAVALGFLRLIGTLAAAFIGAVVELTPLGGRVRQATVALNPTAPNMKEVTS